MLVALRSYRYWITIAVFAFYGVYWGWECYCQGPLNMVVPVLPENNQTITNKKTFRMYWNPVKRNDLEGYSVQIARDMHFKNIVFEIPKTEATSDDIPLGKLDPSEYYWRVAAIANGRRMVWSHIRSFIVE